MIIESVTFFADFLSEILDIEENQKRQPMERLFLDEVATLSLSEPDDRKSKIDISG